MIQSPDRQSMSQDFSPQPDVKTKFDTLDETMIELTKIALLVGYALERIRKMESSKDENENVT